MVKGKGTRQIILNFLVYHVQNENGDGFLSLDYGLREFGIRGAKDRLAYYRRFVYEKGGLVKPEEGKGKSIDLKSIERFRYRTWCFTDSSIIGTKDVVSRFYHLFKDHFSSKHEKRPIRIQGLAAVYSLKRLSEMI